ncbi:MAG: hypothetical protein H6717_41995 [Polyangiaceae bacterium]|nr:hypothetical protein [Polyangiaceae bacterium]
MAALATPQENFDAEIAKSIRTIEHQRNTKRVAVLAAVVLALIAGLAATYLAYSDTPEAAKTLQM